MNALVYLTDKLIGWMNAIPRCVPAVLARFIIAVIFWKSGQTKVSGFSVTESAVFLFQHEYKLPLLDPKFAAYLAAYAEHLFPALLILGLATRFSALALLFMTAVIQIFVYPQAWVTHGLWAVALLTLIKYGPGKLSLDYLLARWFRRQENV